MKKYSLIIVASVLILFSVSCKKETTNSSISSFRIGYVNSTMNLVNVDKTLNLYDGVKYSESESAIFDIDNDGIEDFEFKVYNAQSMGGGNYRSVEIITLDSNFQISIDRIVDTTFVKQTTYTYVDDGDTIVINSSAYFNTNSNPDDTVAIHDIYDRVFPYQYQHGNQLNGSEEWEPGKFILRSLNLSDSYYNYSTYNILFDNWDKDKDQYVLFKRGQGENSRYGWFKLCLVDIDTLVIYEYAFHNLP